MMDDTFMLRDFNQSDCSGSDTDSFCILSAPSSSNPTDEEAMEICDDYELVEHEARSLTGTVDSDSDLELEETWTFTRLEEELWHDDIINVPSNPERFPKLTGLRHSNSCLEFRINFSRDPDSAVWITMRTANRYYRRLLREYMLYISFQDPDLFEKIVIASKHLRSLMLYD